MDIYCRVFDSCIKYIFLSNDDIKNNFWKNKKFDVEINLGYGKKRINLIL